MVKRLIKLSSVHYIVVDYSEIKEDDKFIVLGSNEILTCDGFAVGKHLPKAPISDGIVYLNVDSIFKITHSTKSMTGVLYIDLCDIEKLFGLSVHDRADREYGTDLNYSSCQLRDAFVKGYRECDSIKDEMFSVTDMYSAFNCGRTYERSNQLGVGQNELIDYIKSIRESGWYIEFIDDKITLK